jgi:hypothetical protein
VRLLCIRWDGEAQTWRVVDMDTREVVDSFTHLLDAGWRVQSEERQPS